MKLYMIVSMMLAATGFAATLGARDNALGAECPVNRRCLHNQDCAATYCRCQVDDEGKNGLCRPWPS
ncbi:hypothetical protein FQN49_003995 [Arthroderma sp. PD_2]|nr:hypothetical protein FQN49_003995 [Arthroderma sp. PD_2]